MLPGSTITSARAASPSYISGRGQVALTPTVITCDSNSSTKLGGTLIVIWIVSVFSADWATLRVLKDSRVRVYCPPVNPVESI